MNAGDDEHPVIVEARRLEAAGDPEAAERVLDAEIDAAGATRVTALRFLLEKARLAWAHRGLEAGAPLAAEADKLATRIADKNPVPRVYSLMLMMRMSAAAGEMDSVAQIAGVLARVATRAGAVGIGAQAWATRAEHMVAFGEHDEAVASAKQALALEADGTDDVRDGRTRAYVVLGQVARLHGQADTAVAMFRSATKQGGELPADFEVEFVLARVRAGETGADVVASLDQLADGDGAELPPESRDAARLARLEYWLRRGAFERADAAAAAVPDNYAGRYLRTRLAVSAGRADQAAELAQAMVEAAPEDPRANLLLGAAAVLCGEDEPGVAALARAEQLAEAAGETAVRVEAIVRMGTVMLAGGHLPEARQRAGEAMAAAGDEVALRSDGRLLLGLAQVAGGQVDAGLDELAAASADLRAAGLEARAAQVELHRALVGQGDTDDAPRHAGDRRTLVLALVLGAFAAHADGDAERATAQLVRARELDREGETGLAEAIAKAFERLELQA